MRLITISESIEREQRNEDIPGYIDPKQMKDGTFERQMWMLGTGHACNITIPEEKERLIKYIEEDLHTINRVKSGKMKLVTSKAKRRIPNRTEEYLRDTLEKLKKYESGKAIDEAKNNPFDYDQILSDAFDLKMREEGGDDGIDTIDKFKALPGKKLNNGFCTYIANTVGDDYDVEVEHTLDNEHGNEWLEENDLKAIPNVMNVEHSWWVYKDKVYDIEARDGVDDPLDLPFFKRLKALQ